MYKNDMRIIKIISVTFFFLLNVFLCDNLTAQNYQAVYSNRIAHFVDNSQNVQSLRIDSIVCNIDTIFYPFTVIVEQGNYCYSPFKASWIGEKVIIDIDGNNYFMNFHADSIRIKTSAALNETWMAYHLKDSIVIMATVVKHSKSFFLGIEDSVKTISFQCYDKNMDSLDTPLNEKQIELSENYGLIKTLDFYYFPNINDNGYSSQEELVLVGLTNPQLGVQNITWKDIYNFMAGDELHIIEEFSDWREFGGRAYTRKSVFSYLNKNEIGDTIEYTYARKEYYKENINNEDFTTSFINDTVTERLTPQLDLNFLPNQPIGAGLMSFYRMTIADRLSKFSSTELFARKNDSCWEHVMYDGCISSKEYIEGLGGPYYSCDLSFSFGGYSRYLAYYKKGDDVWGTPLALSSVKKESSSDEVVVMQVNDKLKLIIRGFSPFNSYYIFIYSSEGRLMLEKKLIESETMLELPNVLSGIYLYKVSNNGNLINSGKLFFN